MNFVERYTWFGGDVCQIVLEGPKVSLGQIVMEKSTTLATACKIASMVLSLGILAIVALTIKAISHGLSNRIILAPSILTQPYVSPTLTPPNPEIEAARVKQSTLEIPFKVAIFLRSQTLGTDSPYIIDPILIPKSSPGISSKSPEERQYLDGCLEEEITIVRKECPKMEQVLKEMMPRASNQPPANKKRVQPSITRFRFADPKQIPLHLRPGGYRLGGK